MTIEIIPIHVQAEIIPGDDLARMIHATAPPLIDRDIVVVTQKAVSKAEGQVVDLGGRAAAPRRPPSWPGRTPTRASSR